MPPEGVVQRIDHAERELEAQRFGDRERLFEAGIEPPPGGLLKEAQPGSTEAADVGFRNCERRRIQKIAARLEAAGSLDAVRETVRNALREVDAGGIRSAGIERRHPPAGLGVEVACNGPAPGQELNRAVRVRAESLRTPEW